MFFGQILNPIAGARLAVTWRKSKARIAILQRLQKH